jgi:SNF2 family DNA or RNA helicase
LVSNSTIEEKVKKLKEKKEKLFHSVLDGGELFSKAITAEDIKSLFLD